MAIDEDWSLPVTGTQVLAGGAAVGGYFLLKDVLAGGSEKREQHYREVINQTKSDIEYELENAGEMQNTELRNHIQTYKGRAEAINQNLPKRKRLDLQRVRDETHGESYEAQALLWKQTVLRLGLIGVEDAAGQSALDNIIQALGEHFRLFVMYGSVIAVWVAIIEYLKGGGGLGGLRTFYDMVQNGILGHSSYISDLNKNPEQDDIPESEISPDDSTEDIPESQTVVTGTIAGAAHELGVATAPFVLEIIEVLNVTPNTQIAIPLGILSALSETADKSVDWFLEHPEVAIIVLVAVLAATLLVVLDGPLPFGDMGAAIILGKTAQYAGVTFIGLGTLVAIGNEIRQSTNIA